MKLMEYSDITIQLIKQHRTSISAQFISPNTLQIKAPKFITKTQIQDFLKTHTKWVEKHITLYDNEPKLLKLNYKPNHYILFLGNFYKIDIIDKNEGHQKPRIVAKHIILTRKIGKNISGNLIYTIRIQPTVNNKGIKQALIEFLKKQAKNLLIHKTKTIHAKLQFIAQQNKLTYKQLEKVRITSAKTRWGSCSAKGTISFSYKLVAAPEQTINYVIAHEIAHLVHMNHSKNFWQLVEQLYPNYKQHQKWLKATGRVVQIMM